MFHFPAFFTQGGTHETVIAIMDAAYVSGFQDVTLAKWRTENYLRAGEISLAAG